MRSCAVRVLQAVLGAPKSGCPGVLSCVNGGLPATRPQLQSILAASDLATGDRHLAVRSHTHVTQPFLRHLFGESSQLFFPPTHLPTHHSSSLSRRTHWAHMDAMLHACIGSRHRMPTSNRALSVQGLARREYQCGKADHLVALAMATSRGANSCSQGSPSQCMTVDTGQP